MNKNKSNFMDTGDEIKNNTEELIKKINNSLIDKTLQYRSEFKYSLTDDCVENSVEKVQSRLTPAIFDEGGITVNIPVNTLPASVIKALEAIIESIQKEREHRWTMEAFKDYNQKTPLDK